ncbi:MAG: 16S rRNA (cytosine(967)-C(5))-methyltransferase RsmB [Oscillospiraceae bacterium]|nr:16S rRNA (cytosine(967)-C(5))-methyltransferase RsmB [Oscillospiraceae bacterium]
MGARETALNALIACRKDGAWSNGILKSYTIRDRLDRREAALAARLCYGVLQNRLKLDFYLQQLLTGRLKDLHPAVRDILHLGLYQLYETDRIPDAAAVNESVALAKKYCPKVRSAPGLVNGVLRNAARSRDSLSAPETLWQTYSHPQGLVDLFRSYIGPERLEGMLASNNSAPKTYAQVNTLRTTVQQLQEQLHSEGVTAQPHSWMPDCLILSDTGNLEHLESFRQGLYYIQDPAAKLSVLCAQLPQQPVQVLDCCAAPGGKSFAAAIATKGQAHITCCDIHPHRTELIARGAQRLGITLDCRCQDASELQSQWVGQMDVVIADVPCSGYGIIRKKPDIRYKDPDTMKDLPALQLAILNNQASYVKPGGVLLYSTCTLVRRENEGVVEKFLKQNPDFTTEKLILPDIFPENTTGMLTLVPGEYDTDGFFICRLRRSRRSLL